ncbi:MAG: SpoIIE family protein phosphatase [bacterium]
MPEQTYRLDTIKVCVISDKDSLIQTINTKLDNLGVKSCVIQDCDHLKTAAENKEIQGMFLDAYSDLDDAMDKIHCIRQQIDYHHLPVVAVCKHLKTSHIQQFFELGVDDILPYPIETETLGVKMHAIYNSIKLQHREHERQKQLSVLVEQNKTEQEIARGIFLQAVNRASVEFPDVAHIEIPAETFSGDLILTSPRKGGGLNVLLGDFTGHGLSAAIGALPVSDIFRAMSFHGAGILEIVRELNFRLHELLPTQMFMAGSVLCFSADMKTVAVWNGGMPHLMVSDGESGEIRRAIEPRHLPLGIIADFDSEQYYEVIPLTPNDRIIAFSDGLQEACNQDNVMFGMERVMESLETNNHLNPQQTLQALKQSALDFCGQTKLQDDISIVAVQCTEKLIDAIQNYTFDERIEKTRQQAKDSVQHFTLEIRGVEFDHLDPVSTLVQQLKNCRGPDADAESLQMIFSELLNNAVDHGLLGLDSALKQSPEGFIEFYELRSQRIKELDHNAIIHVGIILTPLKDSTYRLEVTVSDSGEGFDVETVMKNALSDDDLGKTYGRGIKLLNFMAEKLAFEKGGRKVYLSYLWE